jgi:hypothetical protein
MKAYRQGVVATLVFLAGCGGGGGTTPEPAPPVSQFIDFSTGVAGWTGDSADYETGTAPNDVLWSHSALPAPMTGSGFRLSGTNRSDDLFIYVKRQIGGLRAGQRYSVAFQVRIATGTPTGCIGVGGSPGESVWIHAGATDIEPRTVPNGGGFRVNIDRGNQSVGGRQGVVLGTIANSKTDCPQVSFETKLLTTHAPHEVTADSAGRVWVHAGIDSGFESYSEIYLQSLSVVFTPK